MYAQVYSFGVVLYELLSRQAVAVAILAHRRQNDAEICELYAHKVRQPTQPRFGSCVHV